MPLRRNLLDMIYTHSDKMSPKEKCQIDALCVIFSNEGQIQRK